MSGEKVLLICLIFAFYIFGCKMVNGNKSQDVNIPNFGPYDLDIESFTQCKGFKKKNISESIYVPVKRGHNIIVYGNKTNKETVGPAEFKIKLFKWKGTRFEALMTYRSKNACEYKTYTEQVWNQFNKFDEHCNIVKGIIEIKGVDLAAATRLMVGNKHFYGKYKTVSYFYCKDYNIECIEIVTTLTPK